MISFMVFDGLLNFVDMFSYSAAVFSEDARELEPRITRASHGKFMEIHLDKFGTMLVQMYGRHEYPYTIDSRVAVACKIFSS